MDAQIWQRVAQPLRTGSFLLYDPRFSINVLILQTPQPQYIPPRATTRAYDSDSVGILVLPQLPHAHESSVTFTPASQRIDLPIMLADISVSGPTPNTLPFPPLSDPKSVTTDTLLAITSLQTALETHGLLDKGMVDHGAERMVGKPLTDNGQRMRLGGLPVEIHEAILDHLFGVRASTSSGAAKGSQATRGWSNVLRHPRRKQLSNLGLVSPLWRRLVQERLYRHSKSLIDCPLAYSNLL